MYVAPESKVLAALANVAATSITEAAPSGDRDLPEDEF